MREREGERELVNSDNGGGEERKEKQNCTNEYQIIDANYGILF